MNETTQGTTGAPTRVVLLHKAGAATDEWLAHRLELELNRAGCAVFVDRQTQLNLDWAQEIGGRLKDASAVVAVISADALTSEFFVTEIETAHESAQKSGRPALISVRIEGIEELPETLGAILLPRPRFDWHNEADTSRVVRQVIEAVQETPKVAPPVRLSLGKGLRLSPRSSGPLRIHLPSTPQPSASAILLPTIEPAGGAVPLTSEFYIERHADTDLRNAMIRYDSIILLKGARQMGKTSMLARGLQFARERGAKVALTDLQKFNLTNLESVGALYLSLAESLADQLDLNILPSDTWDDRRSPNVNFERFVRREVLAKLNAPLVWGLDEVDRLFTTPYASEVFGLFRSWHNERALDPSGPWAGLTLAISYATEAHLFITDMNQSPFNVGTRIALEDFNESQATLLNRRYGSPLSEGPALTNFLRLVGGHPFLVRRGLYELATKKTSSADFHAAAVKDDGPFGEHLRRILVLLARDPKLMEVVRGMLKGRGIPDAESFFRLRSAGLIHGESQESATFRCELYSDYLRRHLL